MKKRILTLVIACTFALTACAGTGEQRPWGMGDKQTVGTAGGAILGGLLGSKVGGGSGKLWATGAGALLGAYMGSSVGKSLDQADMAYHQQAAQQAYTAPLNRTIRWSNPESGHSGTITPIREGTQASSGAVCRQFKQAIMIGGQAETAVSTACQNGDGTWTVQ
jgi:surface antigen